jgi:lysophospholipase L1-like esterase
MSIEVNKTERIVNVTVDKKYGKSIEADIDIAGQRVGFKQEGEANFEYIDLPKLEFDDLTPEQLDDLRGKDAKIFIPINSRIVFLGDSMTGRGGEDKGPLTRGFFWVANHLLNSYFYPPIGANKGVGGETIKRISDRVGAVTALNPQIVTVLAGANDFFSSPDANSMISYLQIIYKNIISTGAKVVAITILPSFGDYILTNEHETIRIEVNNWIKSQSSDNILVVDAENAMNDPSLFEDGLHPNGAGGIVLGELTADVIRPFIKSGLRISDILSIDNALVKNPFFEGNLGSLNAGSTGEVADDWILDQWLSGGAIVSGSKILDNSEVKQVVTISGDYSGDNKNASLIQFYDIPTILKKGEVVEGYLDYEIQSMNENILGVYLKTEFRNPSGTTIAACYTLTPTESEQFPIGRYTGRINPLKLTDDVSKIVYRVEIKFKNTSILSPINAEIKFNKVGVKKINTGANGSYTTTDNKTVTVTDGIITNIV